jgi:hypothetical protein
MRVAFNEKKIEIGRRLCAQFLRALADRIEPPVVAADPPPHAIQALKRKFPGAPAAWLAFVARNTADLDPEIGQPDNSGDDVPSSSSQPRPRKAAGTDRRAEQGSRAQHPSPAEGLPPPSGPQPSGSEASGPAYLGAGVPPPRRLPRFGIAVPEALAPESRVSMARQAPRDRVLTFTVSTPPARPALMWRQPLAQNMSESLEMNPPPPTSHPAPVGLARAPAPNRKPRPTFSPDVSPSAPASTSSFAMTPTIRRKSWPEDDPWSAKLSTENDARSAAPGSQNAPMTGGSVAAAWFESGAKSDAPPPEWSRPMGEFPVLGAEFSRPPSPDNWPSLPPDGENQDVSFRLNTLALSARLSALAAAQEAL